MKCFVHEIFHYSCPECLKARLYRAEQMLVDVFDTTTDLVEIEKTYEKYQHDYTPIMLDKQDQAIDNGRIL